VKLSELNRIVKDAGGQLWLVGGAVRDSLLGKIANDRDFMVTGVEIDALPFDNIVGSDFPVFLVEVDGETCEIALARSEKKAGKGYHGFAVSVDSSITVEDDLSRRDLTINAMAQNVETCEIVDPFNGADDIVNRVIRHVSDAFAEDPTRVYRVARFAAKFGFKVADETMALIKNMKSELIDIKTERVEKELMKVLVTSKPSIFFQILKDANLLDVHFSAVAALDVPDMHDGTAFNHTMRVMDAADNPQDRFALLCHDFGKGVTPADMHPKHHGHDQLGVDVVNKFCDDLRISNKLRKAAISACKLHMKAKRVLEMNVKTLIKFVVSNKNIEDILRVSRIDSCAREGASQNDVNLHDAINKRVAMAQNVINKVTGNLLLSQGVVPGKNFGERLHAARVSAAKAMKV
jgi:tRNA nucleotidyltransferase (CCA-adding enzyme)